MTAYNLFYNKNMIVLSIHTYKTAYTYTKYYSEYEMSALTDKRKREYHIFSQSQTKFTVFYSLPLTKPYRKTF